MKRSLRPIGGKEDNEEVRPNEQLRLLCPETATQGHVHGLISTLNGVVRPVQLPPSSASYECNVGRRTAITEQGEGGGEVT